MEQELHRSREGDLRSDSGVWERVHPALEPYPAGPDQGMDRALPAPRESIGGVQDPCCMGSAAQEMIQVIQGFLEEELWDRRRDLMLSRRAPSFARNTLREIAAESEHRARRLMAAYYLITGRCAGDPIPRYGGGGAAPERWCPALRERYHTEICNAMNYVRAAEGTADPCLARLFRELGESADHSAQQIVGLLERTL